MNRIHFYFDYVDPASFVMENRVRRVADELGLGVEMHPFEIREPSADPVSATDPAWIDRWERVEGAVAETGLSPNRPDRVPHTRKAHELRLHAVKAGREAEVHDALWRAALSEAVDIGRIDRLVAVGEAHGLDRTETRAVLDVDRFTEAVQHLRAEALDAGIRGVPALRIGDDRMEGVHAADAIREFVTSYEPHEE